MKHIFLFLLLVLGACSIQETVEPDSTQWIDVRPDQYGFGWTVTPIVLEGGLLFYGPTYESVHTTESSGMWCNGQRFIRREYETNYLRYEWVDYRTTPNGEIIQQIVLLDTIQ